MSEALVLHPHCKTCGNTERFAPAEGAWRCLACGEVGAKPLSMWRGDEERGWEYEAKGR